MQTALDLPPHSAGQTEYSPTRGVFENGLRGAGAWLVPALMANSLLGQSAPDAERLSGGANFVATPVFAAAEDQRLLEQFRWLRVADLCDGRDAVGLRSIGLMDPVVRPGRNELESANRPVLAAIARSGRVVQANTNVPVSSMP